MLSKSSTPVSHLFKEHYIKHGKKTQGKRKIYSSVQYDDYETQKIKELKAEV